MNFDGKISGKINLEEKILEEKRELRQRLLKIRNAIPEYQRVEKSKKIYDFLLQNEKYKNADSIFFFAGYESEVQTIFMIEDAIRRGKIIALPKVISATEMSFFKIDSITSLKNGYKGIPEPDDSSVNISERPDLLIMPGLAFDNKLNRIGYGKGYYDRYLSNLNSHINTIALCFEEQIVDYLPSDEYDIRPDIIISDQRIIV